MTEMPIRGILCPPAANPNIQHCLEGQLTSNEDVFSDVEEGGEVSVTEELLSVAEGATGEVCWWE